MRILSLAVVLAAFVVSAAATAGPIARPPSVLSPDLTQPWHIPITPDQWEELPIIFVPADAVLTYREAYGGDWEYIGPPVAPAGTPDLEPIYLPKIVPYHGPEVPGTIIIDTNARFLYLIIDGGQARRYGVGVGREGFEWSGVNVITRKAEWPRWTPPPEMVARDPVAAQWASGMPGGPDNPLGARALYLGETLYRIHGTNAPWTIGHAVSSGCIRMRNEDVIDLYNRVAIGAKVIVL